MTYRWQMTEFAELNTAELYAALQLRQEVFAVEQDCRYKDLDNLEQSAVHMLCWKDSGLLEYQRCLPPGEHFVAGAI